MSSETEPVSEPHGSSQTGRATFWGSLTRWGPYTALVSLIYASPSRQFFLLAALPILWVLTQHLGPMLQMLRVSLTDAYPVAPGVEQHFTLENYTRFFGEQIF